MVKAFRVIGTSALFLLLGWTLPADSRQEQKEKPKGQEKQQENGKPEKKQSPPAKSARQANPQPNRQQEQQRQSQQQRPAKQPAPQREPQQKQANRQPDQQRQPRQDQNTRSAQQRSPEQMHQQQAAWQHDRANRWESEHRSWQQRGGYNGYRVPDARFRVYYGPQHFFRIQTLQVRIIGGQRRFQYGGYWFGLVDPWPEYWATNWYDDDDVYVDYYGDGYYLFNRRHPSDRIAISFYLN
jgi:hypothetical protein